jgi:hypothetical protein
LVRENDVTCHENLQVAKMVILHHLAKSIREAGWGAFLIILTNTAACAGRKVVAVNPAFTSQRCSGCGVVVQKGLSVRWHSCSQCGASLHRDHTAARNIERAGQALRGGVALAASENRASVGLLPLRSVSSAFRGRIILTSRTGVRRQGISRRDRSTSATTTQIASRQATWAISTPMICAHERMICP